MAQLQILIVSAMALSAALFATSHPANAQDLFIEGDMVRGNQEGAPGPDLRTDQPVSAS